MYLKSRLNCLLCHSNITPGQTDSTLDKEATDSLVKDQNDNNDDADDIEQQHDDEELWQQMGTVTSSKVKKLKRSKDRDEGIISLKKKKAKKM